MYRSFMPTTVIKAHYDGERIVLDDPVELPKHAPLLVTVCSPDTERSDWADVSSQGLARAYGDSEPEYSTEDLRSCSPSS